jgi:hypothetical protein
VYGGLSEEQMNTGCWLSHDSPGMLEFYFVSPGMLELYFVSGILGDINAILWVHVCYKGLVGRFSYPMGGE